ncbi:hypothetical protein [Acetobacterium sp.]|uniref:hypothetical protein n=1 Tax=Acetobacterium sp. TaxID=1872094 RepID=UPI002F40449A
MSKNKLIRFLLVIILYLGCVIMFSGCSQNDSNKVTKNETKSDSSTTAENSGNGIANDNVIFNFYNKVYMDQTKADVEAATGIVAELGENGLYTYVDPNTGYGVFVNYNDGNRVIVKGIFTPVGAAELIALSNATVTEDQVASITKGMTYEEVKTILVGEGLEIVCTVNPQDLAKPLYLMVWLNNDGSSLSVTLNGPKGIVYSAKFRNV